ncbi:YHS domain-containing protein [Sediminibacterium sp.]|uniref:YHS domain-containing protein n=1 Tax=Sediminibacterium sp. TaxID=1917865 RepID=UPI003F6FB959
MNIVKTLFVGLLFITMASCNEEKKADDKAAENTMAPIKHGSSMHATSNADSAGKFTPAMVANKRDFICGMPVTAGIADTAHYKGKVYGFCATECKTEFLQSPDAHIAAK